VKFATSRRRASGCGHYGATDTKELVPTLSDADIRAFTDSANLCRRIIDTLAASAQIPLDPELAETLVTTIPYGSLAMGRGVKFLPN